VVLVAALQLDRDADVTNRLWGCFVGSLTRLSQRIGSSRLDATSNTTTQQTQVGRIYSAGGATAAAAKYIVPTQIQKTAKLKRLEPFKNNLLAVYSILF